MDPFDPEMLAGEPPAEMVARARVAAMKRRGIGASMGDSTREIVAGMMGAPGTAYGEGARAALAGARSLLPSGGTYRAERDAIDTDEGLSQIPEVRRSQILEANKQDMIGMGAGMAAPIVFHGSPHVFDKFSMQKIGTGEGAQAYGHGLYFTEQPGIAESYRSTLARPNRLLIQGKEIGDTALPAQFNALADDWFRAPAQGGVRAPIRNPKMPGEGDIASMREILRMKRDFWAKEQEKFKSDPDLYERNGRLRHDFQQALDFAEQLKPDDFKQTGEGAFYHADIPDNVLHWDKPVSEQPHVVAAIQKDSALQAGLKPHNFKWKGNESTVDPGRLSVSGEGYFKALEDALGAKDAADALRAAGIPGHSYIGDSSGVRNYVMYDDAPIKVLGRYGSLAEYEAAQEASARAQAMRKAAAK